MKPTSRRLFQLLLLSQMMFIGAIASAESDRAEDPCYKPFWKTKLNDTGKRIPYLTYVKKSAEELSLPERYACEYGSMGSVQTADLKIETCRECSTYDGNPFRQLHEELSTKVSLFEKSPALRDLTRSEKEKFGGSGAIIPTEDCITPGVGRCPNGSGTLVLENQNVVIACKHEFFKDDGTPRNKYSSNSAQWWSGYSFRAWTGNYYDQIEFERGIDLSGVKGNPQDSELVILKLKRPMSNVDAMGLVDFDDNLLKYGKKHPPILVAHHYVNVANNDYSQHIQKISDRVEVTQTLDVSDFSVDGALAKGKRKIVYHRGNTYIGASGGSLTYLVNSLPYLAAVHCGGTGAETGRGEVVKRPANEFIANRAIGISPVVRSQAEKLSNY
ncbi:MAG: hypothetical protein KDD61_09995 [Bdellovibrionales bacterium]|nr:hypothetical protein [Bdellovibrionales bacterium]